MMTSQATKWHVTALKGLMMLLEVKTETPPQVENQSSAQLCEDADNRTENSRRLEELLHTRHESHAGTDRELGWSSAWAEPVTGHDGANAGVAAETECSAESRWVSPHLSSCETWPDNPENLILWRVQQVDWLLVHTSSWNSRGVQPLEETTRRTRASWLAC